MKRENREESAEVKQNLTNYGCEDKHEVQDESNLIQLLSVI